MEIGDKVRNIYTKEVGVIIKFYPNNEYNCLVKIDKNTSYLYKENQLEKIK